MAGMDTKPPQVGGPGRPDTIPNPRSFFATAPIIDKACASEDPPRSTRDKSIGHIGQLNDLDGTDGTDVVCSTRPQSVRNVIFPVSDVVELVETVLCKQQVTGSSPVRSI